MTSAASTLVRRKWHSILGVGPLLAFLLLHAWEANAAIAGRDAFTQRFALTTSSLVGLLLKSVITLLPLLVHAALGIGVLRRVPDEGPLARYASKGLRRLQALTGSVVALFLIFHLVRTWAPLIYGADAGAAYDSLTLHAGVPFEMTLYVLGIVCVSFHVGQGLVAASVTWGWVSDAASLARVRIVVGIVAFLLFLVFLNSLSHFATGRALVFEETSVIHGATNLE